MKSITEEHLKEGTYTPAEFKKFQSDLIERTRDLYLLLQNRVDTVYAEYKAWVEDPANNRQHVSPLTEAPQDIRGQLRTTPIPPGPKKSQSAFNAWERKYKNVPENGILKRLKKAASPKEALLCFMDWQTSYKLGHYRALLTALATWRGDEEAKAALTDFTPIFELASSKSPHYEDMMRGSCFFEDMRILTNHMVEQSPSAVIQKAVHPHRVLVNFKNTAPAKDWNKKKAFAQKVGVDFEFYLARLYMNGKISTLVKEFGDKTDYRTYDNQVSFGFDATGAQTKEIVALLHQRTKPPAIIEHIWSYNDFRHWDFVYAVNGVVRIDYGETADYANASKMPMWDGIYKFPGVLEARSLAHEWRNKTGITNHEPKQSLLEQFGRTSPKLPKGKPEVKGHTQECV